jgi:hypothetical protein
MVRCRGSFFRYFFSWQLYGVGEVLHASLGAVYCFSDLLSGAHGLFYILPFFHVDLFFSPP